ncbi:hypothetical protein EJB05_28515, partial [Eragrostis curvula]
MALEHALAPVLPQVLPARHSLVHASGRRCRFAVAASPPVEEAVRATDTQPLTKEDLVSHLASGCKPRCDWRVGTEHEKFGFLLETLRPINYGHIRELLNGIADRFGWRKVMEGNNVIGLKKVKSVGKEMGIGFLGLGFQPKWALSDMPMMPKARYLICKNYMPKVGSFGLDVMFRTCSVQVNLDFSSEEDMIMKFRSGIALQPIATAIFANSPFKEGNLSGFNSLRSHTYTDCDSNRTGMLPFVFDRSFGFERYADYALDVPMICAYRNKKHIDCTGMSFRDFIVGKLPQIPGEHATLKDWEYHLGAIHTEVRLKKFLEMRGADGGPLSTLCAVPAFWVGLLYDDESLRAIVDMTADWTNEEREMLRRKVPISGLMTPFRGGYVKDIAADIVKLAKDGLQRRQHHEVGFLNEVEEIVQIGNNTIVILTILIQKTIHCASDMTFNFCYPGVGPSEKLSYLFKTKWQCNIDSVFHELAY